MDSILNTEQAELRFSGVTENFTSIEWETLSWYSTSASAKAEPQSMHQWTGFSPFSKWPFATILPSALTVSASNDLSKDRYGFCQSPNTPKRWKSFFCFSTCSKAYERHNDLNLVGSIFLPCFFSTTNSIGNPWQSHPGIYGASYPERILDLTIKSFKILLTAWPIWISPFA